MCVTYEDESSTSTSIATDAGAGIEQIVVTAPRISIDMSAFQMIDWSEVTPMTLLGGVSGVFSGWPGVLVGATIGTAGAIESQDGIDLIDLFQVTDDIYAIQGLPAPYVPMF